ncbi:hypothetical protein JXQ70_11750 [bacterium]|nr:hypothetical protein [bacterium]
MFLAPYGLSYTDEGFFLESVQRIVSGQRPFIDFYCSYFPGRFYLGAAIVKILGDDIVTMRLALCLLWGLLPVMLYRIILFFGHRTVALFGSALILVLAGPYYNRFYPLCVGGNLLLMLLYLHRNTGAMICLVGLTAGLSTWFRQDVGLAALVIDLAVLLIFSLEDKVWSCLRRSLLLVGTYMVTVLPLFVPTLFSQAYRHGLSITFDFAGRAYFSTWQLPYPTLFSLWGDGLWLEYGFWELFTRFLFPYQLMIILVHCLVVLWSIRPNVHEHRDICRHILLLFWQLTALYYVSLRTSETHFFMAALPFYAALAILWARGLKALFRSTNRYVRLASTLSMFLLLPSILLFVFSWSSGDFYSGSPGVLRHGMVRPISARVNVKMEPALAGQLTEIVRTIQERTRTDQKLLTFPCFSMLNYACDRSNPSYYLWLTPEVVTETVESQVISELECRDTPYLIGTDLRIDQIESRQFSVYAPRLYTYITDHYSPLFEFEAKGWEGSLTLLRREPGRIIVRFHELLRWGAVNEVKVKGRVMIETMDLGHGRVSYLLLSPGTILEMNCPVPGSGQVQLAMLSPELVSLDPIIPAGLHLVMTLTDLAEMETQPLLSYEKTVLSGPEVTAHQTGPVYLDSTRPASGSFRLRVAAETIGFEAGPHASIWLAIGYPRLIALSDRPHKPASSGDREEVH